MKWDTVNSHCYYVDLTGNTGDLCNLRAGLRVSLPGRAEGLCVTVPVQHPQVPHQPAAHDHLLRGSGKNWAVVLLLHCPDVTLYGFLF